MNNWKTSQDQQSGSICRTLDFFIDELTELKEELDCPNEFIYDFLEVVRNHLSSNSCYSKARQHKQDNPSFY